MAPRRSKRKAAPKEPNDGDDPSRPALSGMAVGSQVSETKMSNDGSRQEFVIPFNDKSIIAERRGDSLTEHPTLVFTHGAGGGLTNAATKDFATGFGQVSPIVCFQGTMNLQSRVRAFRAVEEHVKYSGALGGRSMGARAAVLARDGKTTALILVSYPLIGGKNNEMRDQILLDLPEDIDVLFMLGTNDRMCPREQLDGVRRRMRARTWLTHVEGLSRRARFVLSETLTYAT